MLVQFDCTSFDEGRILLSYSICGFLYGFKSPSRYFVRKREMLISGISRFIISAIRSPARSRFLFRSVCLNISLKDLFQSKDVFAVTVFII